MSQKHQDPPDQKAQTARENGAKSKGPITPEGKRRSSVNALKHGLSAHTVAMIQGECREKMLSLMEATDERFKPVGAFEIALTGIVGGALWRARRVADYEASLLDVEL